jgi:hypothetical protein
MQNPKPDREPALWVAALIVGAAIITGLGATAFFWVSVPLLWPLAATLGCLWLGARDIDRRVLQRQEEELRNPPARPALPPRSTRAIIYDADRNGTTRERVGDAERDVFAAALRTHFEAGRLEQDEFEERLAAALEARTVTDLAYTVRDLPSEVTGR